MIAQPSARARRGSCTMSVARRHCVRAGVPDCEAEGVRPVFPGAARGVRPLVVSTRGATVLPCRCRRPPQPRQSHPNRCLRARCVQDIPDVEASGGRRTSATSWSTVGSTTPGPGDHQVGDMPAGLGVKASCRCSRVAATGASGGRRLDFLERRENGGEMTVGQAKQISGMIMLPPLKKRPIIKSRSTPRRGAP